MKFLFLTAAVLLGVAACGGGGDPESGSGDPPVSTTPSTPLAAYIGNWAADCRFHAIERVAVSRTPGTTDSISMSYKTEHYANENCTGAILGTWTQTASATAVYEGTVDSSIVFTPGSAAVPAKVDKVRTSLPEHNWVVAGPGVVHRVVNGYADWCINYANGDGACYADAGPYSAAAILNPFGLYFDGSVMYSLGTNGSSYAVNKSYKKQ